MLKSNLRLIYKTYFFVNFLGGKHCSNFFNNFEISIKLCVFVPFLIFFQNIFVRSYWHFFANFEAKCGKFTCINVSCL
jgi:hypothetical protein